MIDDASYRKVFRTFPLPGLLLIPDAPVFTIVEVTDALSTFIGRDRAELINKGFFEGLFNGSAANEPGWDLYLRSSFEKVIDEKLVSKADWPEQTASHQKVNERSFCAESRPIVSDAGDLQYILISIVESDTATRHLHYSQTNKRFLEKILESSLDVICSIDEEDSFVAINAAAERLWGYSPDYLLGKKYADFVYPPDLEKTKTISLAVREGKDLRFFENRIICKNGKHMTMIWSAKWEPDHKLFYCIAKDATEKKNAELEMQLMIDNTDESFVLLDKNLFITAYNQLFFNRYKEHFGKEIRKGTSILDYSVSGDHSHLLLLYKKVLEGHTESSEITIPFPDKAPKVFALKYKPAKKAEGEVVGVFITIKDITEATIARQTIEASEEKYKLLFYNSPMAMWIYETESLKILDVNDAAVQNYGYTREEFGGLGLLHISYDRDIYKILAFHNEAQETEGRIYFGKDTHRKKDGSQITVDVYGYKVRYDHKDCVVVVSNDVTEKEIAIQQLKDNEAKLLTAQKIAKIGYWQLQWKSKEFYWSDEIYKIWGVSKENFDVNRDSFKTLYQEDIPLFLERKEELLHGSGSVDFEHRIVLPDGTIKWVREKGEIIRNEKGDAVIIEGTVQDITEGKLLELSLAESSQRYEYVTKATSDAIWDWNLETDEIFWGDGILQIFGYEKSSLSPYSSSWRDNIHPDDAQKIEREVGAIIQGTDSFWTNEYRFKKADQSFAFVLDRAFLIRDNNGKATRIVGSLQDISRRKKEESRLKLLESVTTNTSDGVMILESRTKNKLLPEIIYANEAFCKMTSFSADELLGKSLAFLEGLGGDPGDADQFLQALQKEKTFERTAKIKTGDGRLLWVNTIYNLVSNKTDARFQWVAINRNVTQRKNDETKKALLAEISQIFNGPQGLKDTLHKVLEKLNLYENIGLAEIWLTGADRDRINLVTWFSTTGEVEKFYKDTSEFESFSIGEGFPGAVWKKGKVLSWKDISSNKLFLRRGAMTNIGVNAVLGLPLTYNEELIGVLVIGFTQGDGDSSQFRDLFESLAPHLSAEIKRKQLEQDLNQIFNFSPDVICIAGSNGYYKKVNPALSQLLEYTEDELLSTPMDHFVHPADREKTAKRFQNLGPGKAADYIENRLVSKSGKIYWLAWTATSGNKEGSYFCIAKDITEKKNLEHLLNEANRLARIGSWEYNVNERKLFWSDITKEIHGYDEDFTPDPTSNTEHVKPGRNKELLENAIATALESASGWDLEIQIITAKGEEKWVRTIGELEYYNGQPYRIYGSMQDIDARKRAEEELRKSNEIYTIVSRTINDSIWEWDVATNQVIRPGKKLEPLLGYEEMPTLKVDAFLQAQVMPADRERVFSRLKELVGDPSESYWEDEYKILRADGTYATFFDRAYIMRDEEGKAVRIIGASQDITKLKESELQLKALNEELQKHVKELAASNAELEQFAYIASHDLQEPLRMVTSFLSQIEKKYTEVLDDKGKQYIFYAVDGAKRMRQIILDLLEFSRVGRNEDDLEPIDVNELLNEITILFSKKIAESDARVEWGNMPVVKSFKSPLRQVFQNLIGNALKYQKPGTSPIIEISCEDEKTHWQFSVIDNGIGIDAEYFERIFVIFQRLHNKDEYSGTGIGLAIVKKIVENMGGKVWIVSEEGKGSAFYFTVAKLS